MKSLFILLFSFLVVKLAAQNNSGSIVNTQKPIKIGDSVYQAADFPGGVVNG